MAYIRSKKEELTGYQASGEIRPSVDLGCDFIMVYGIDPTMPERIRQYREKGYVIHLMTGIAWGEYQEYLDGKWDGRKHWDEGQVDRNGKDVIHNPTVPYMVPTVSFSEYLTDRLKVAVDAGVEAIHVEEPEFWDKSGYSEAFKREYEIYYKEPWKPQHESLDAQYKCCLLYTSVGKSRRNISELMDIRPDYANIEKEDGTLEQVDPDEVEIGSVIVVQPGEKVPIDGVIEEGRTSLNTSALTGESLPREAGVGDEVISGCINMSGVLKIRTTKEFGESTVSKILDMVENASSKKSRSENFISKFAKYYTPAVCYGALALAILPPLVRLLFLGMTPEWGDWVMRALTFLVISCPCALVISIPLSFFAGIGGASNAGVLVKGSNYLETLSETKYVVFDLSLIHI